MNFGRSSGWIVACQPQPVSSGDEQPVYSCQARFANSAEPSARAHTTNAGIVSTRAWRSIGSVLRPTPCASAVMVSKARSNGRHDHNKFLSPQSQKQRFMKNSGRTLRTVSTFNVEETLPIIERLDKYVLPPHGARSRRFASARAHKQRADACQSLRSARGDQKLC